MTRLDEYDVILNDLALVAGAIRESEPDSWVREDRREKYVGYLKGAYDLIVRTRPRLLSLDEADIVDVCWLETPGCERLWPVKIAYHGIASTAHYFARAPQEFASADYGGEWRCWAGYPSDEMRGRMSWDG